MTTVAVMQPTFLPWLGYLDLMDQVDHFVYLDSVQFSRQSWQQRNRIRTQAGLSWISVPVDRVQGLGTPIDSVRVKAGTDFPAKVIDQITENYRKAPHWDSLGPVLDRLEQASGGELLVDLLLDLLDVLRDALGIDTPTTTSSASPAAGRRSDLVVELLAELGCTRYVSPPGARQYLVDDIDRYHRAGIEVVIHDYAHPEYAQRFAPFESHASAIDLLANCGTDAAGELRSGRRSPVPLEHGQPAGASR